MPIGSIVQVLIGGLEVGAGYSIAAGGGTVTFVSGGFSSPISVPAIAFGLFLGAHGCDNVTTGANNLFTGGNALTFTERCLDSAGIPPELAVFHSPMTLQVNRNPINNAPKLLTIDEGAKGSGSVLNVAPNRLSEIANARHAAWGNDLNAVNGTIERLGGRALRLSGGDGAKAEQLFESYVNGVSNRLQRTGSGFGVEWQPAAIVNGERVPAFVWLHRGNSWNSPLISDAAGNPRLFAFPGSRRLDAGVIDITVAPNSQGLYPVLSGFDITVDASKPSIVRYYQQYFGDIPIYDIRLTR